tara:strand:+ start:21 stop:1001 length:981 start_codon:yes stop_codon:yes gene_type:complete
MILVAYGTRPEWIKLEKLVNKLKEDNEVKVLFTGQQKDIGQFEYDESLEIKDGDNRLNSIVSTILDSDIFEGVCRTVVQGDTATAFAVALASFHRQIPIVHVEAGLRTHDRDNPYPEESYRQMISCMSTHNMCPTTQDAMNLELEKKNGQKYVVGNTVIDNLPDLDITYDDFVLVTLHRRENHENMKAWFKEVNNLAKNYPLLRFVLPLHPNPNVQKHKDILTDVEVIEPVPYPKMLQMIANCRMIISDSGGIQEEASFYKKKVLVCRKTTERQAGLNRNLMLIENPSLLSKAFDVNIKQPKLDNDCPFGDGQAHIKIASILGELS